MSLLRSSLLVGVGAVASRILGFVRDILFAQVLGAGPVADAFLAAFRLPNLVRRVVAEGGLNPALVPSLTRLEPDEAATMAGNVTLVFGCLLLGIVAVVEVGAGAIGLLVAPGLASQDGVPELVALYTRLAFPAVFGVTLASIGAAFLNVRRRYLAATFAPLVVNGGLILALVAISQGLALAPERQAAWLSVASSVAGLLQLGLIAAALASGEDKPVRFRRPVWSPALKSLLLAGLPALVASGAVQLFVLAGTQVASFWPSGVSWLYYAERVMQLPLGLMAALAASVLLPELASRHRDGGTDAVVVAQNRALALALFLALPAAAALVILAEPISTVLFQRGAFDPQDARGTALVLMGLSAGLPFATAGKVLSQTLFARGSLRGTLLAAVAGIVVTIGGAALLGVLFGMGGIALGISLGCLAHAGAMVFLLRRAGLWRLDREIMGKIAGIGLATIAMGLFLAGLRYLMPEPRIPGLAVLCLGGLAFYAAAAWLFGAVTGRDLALLTKKP
ncbi:murein biosynthesis integral membrane protein MurJ [Microvirga rosea]|uniref:murein biosynthesis integral membrane protein MurJ n=1 Tax=Microvirga rosea TaxID=2715425 RepID=UPI001D0B76C5|nr:murein biosynthesis integral membrane protein MurJ [Microvirga rosea]MCB8819262.1 murein biosynthesis integral membrane protein MurJ [Microvirga rosea]